MILTFDRSRPLRFALAVGLSLFTLGAGKRGKPLQRRTVEIVVIGVHAIAVALKAAAHGAQKGLKLVADTMFQEGPHSRLDSGGAPTCPRGVAHRRFRRNPVLFQFQMRAQSGQQVVESRAGMEIEPEPHQPLALFVGHGRIAKAEQ